MFAKQTKQKMACKPETFSIISQIKPNNEIISPSLTAFNAYYVSQLLFGVVVVNILLIELCSKNHFGASFLVLFVV